jgi:predicted Zn-ribbon and HTH transcriptional regulator
MRAILVAADTLAALRALIARGATLRQAADRLQKPRSTLGRLARRENLALRPRGLSPEKRALVQRLAGSGLGGRRLAQQAEVSRRTAWRYQQLAKFRALLKRANTPLPCKPWRCSKCGALINLTICVACGTRKAPKAAKPRS